MENIKSCRYWYLVDTLEYTVAKYITELS